MEQRSMIEFRIWRQDGPNGSAYWDEFEVPYSKGLNVISALMKIRENPQTKDGKKVVSFDNCIIAAGSQSARIPGFPYDDPRLMDSTGALVRESTRVAESSGYPTLDSAALAGAPALRFAPAESRGTPVATLFLQPVHFRNPGLVLTP